MRLARFSFLILAFLVDDFDFFLFSLLIVDSFNADSIDSLPFVSSMELFVIVVSLLLEMKAL